MNTHPKSLMIFLTAMLGVLAGAPDSKAADLAVETHHGHATHHHRVAHRYHWRVVADYDGTPVRIERPRAVVMRDYAGIQRVVSYTSDVYPMLNIYNPRSNAVPTRYLNGQPVRRGYLRAY